MIRPKVAQPTKREESAAYQLVALRDGEACQRCGKDCGPIARDHRRNRSQRGQTVVENLQVLGLDCHTWKTEHPFDANRLGWGCPGWAKPSEWPARRWVKTVINTRCLVWVLYVKDIEYFSHPKGYRIITELEAQNRIAGLVEGVRG